MLSIEERLERDKLFKVGDKVTIRSVNDMINEYGVNDLFSDQPDVLFDFPVDNGEAMDQYCGKTFEIIDKSEYTFGCGYELQNIKNFCFSSDMFNVVINKFSEKGE